MQQSGDSYRLVFLRWASADTPPVWGGPVQSPGHHWSESFIPSLGQTTAFVFCTLKVTPTMHNNTKVLKRILYYSGQQPNGHFRLIKLTLKRKKRKQIKFILKYIMQLSEDRTAEDLSTKWIYKWFCLQFTMRSAYTWMIIQV